MEDYQLTVESKQVLRAFVVYSLFKALVNDEAYFARLDLNTWWTAQAKSFNGRFS